MTNEKLKRLALENGFSRAYVFLPERAPRPEINQLNERVSDDAREIYENTQRVIVLLYPYEGFEKDDERPSISAYYVASNRAYHAAKRVADEIKKEGYEAFSNSHIAIKPFLLKMGVGETGRNSLVSVEGLGTRFHAQVILTDMPMDADKPGKTRFVSEMCADCAACVRACPSGAILMDGKIDIERCLRARDDGEVVPENLRKLYKNRILGCDVCQEVCPRNGKMSFSRPDQEFVDHTSLENLLDGKVKDLTDMIGRNYARRERIRLKAIVAAANMNRFDLIGKIREILENGTEKEKEHARWAIERLTENKQDDRE